MRQLSQPFGRELEPCSLRAPAEPYKDRHNYSFKDVLISSSLFSEKTQYLSVFYHPGFRRFRVLDVLSLVRVGVFGISMGFQDDWRAIQGVAL